MSPPTSVFQPRSAFDAFLFAPVGDDEKGMVVSVLSALARLDVDPWQEADKLATLPTQIARTELACAIARLPDIPQARIQPLLIADRLITLLPHNQRSSDRPPWLQTRVVRNTRSRAILIMLVLFALAMGSYALTLSRQSATPRAETQSTSQFVDAGGSLQ